VQQMPGRDAYLDGLLEFINRSEVVHFLGPPGTGKSHPSLALGVQAVKAGRSVYFTPLSDLISALAKAEREGTLREKIRFFCRFSLLIVDEIGYPPVVAGGGNLFFQLVNARYEKGDSQNGARSSAIPSSQPHSSTGCYTTPLSSRSRFRVIGSVSTAILYPTTSAQMPQLNRRPRRSSVAVDHRKHGAADRSNG
jgi:IstB-like ATP binding protein